MKLKDLISLLKPLPEDYEVFIPTGAYLDDKSLNKITLDIDDKKVLLWGEPKKTPPLKEKV